MTYSELAKRARLPLGFILGAAYLVWARPGSWPVLLIGGAIAGAGVGFRGWASGHISKNERLATSGPYAHTRNPLYFGSFLIAVGFAVAAHWSLVVAVVAFFALVYAPTMQRERANISSRFPDSYGAYSANVPAFVPRARPWRPAGVVEHGRFSRALYMKHGEWKAGITYLIVMAWLALRTARGF